MSEHVLNTDYLIVGSGAMGMAFADTILTETEANIVIVDRHHKPGGHWNDAYPFVTLHQPSAYYGVSSVELSKGRKDRIGLNKGLSELASGAEVSGYFEEVMRHQFLPTGRVRYFPKCDYVGDGTFVSILTGETHKVRAAKKIVDATYLKTSVPSTHTPNFTVAAGLAFMPINGLPRIEKPPSGFVIIGGGKTGIDACLWLLEQGVNPDSIQWIMPRDAWLVDRTNTQSGDEFFSDSIGAQAAQTEAIANAASIDDLFERLETAGVLLRIDKNVQPKMFHGATISQAELRELQRIRNIVRMGHVQRIEKDRIVLDKGTVATDADRVYVDCSARAIRMLDIVPVFSGNKITLQTVRMVQPVFSAAFIAHVEAAYDNENDKNRICSVVPLPNHHTDWIKAMAATMMNQYTWSQDSGLRNWLVENRLDGFSRMVRNAPKDDAEKQEILKRMRDNSRPAAARLQQFLAELG
ncbi:MAG: NAD(P)-binding protein [Gammaproteobacteria bacterium]|nr:NAD(P)-binding protein [Gammaproteobacteria bacterium]MDH4315050.1 NAD(P)-binding protein [Gammaproteobacteria bacterium]MDH5214043.1 NAD(P)-binding protein [Gammaproteobacteria bacterium]MDH5499665.1 NAD(P)-binding protein [Gammaproteobacteria bacterium]